MTSFLEIAPPQPGRSREPVRVVEERPRIYHVGGHSVQEVVVEGQPIAWVRCLVCGAGAPLMELNRLKAIPCGIPGREDVKPSEEPRPPEKEQRAEKGVCEYCGNDAYAKYPAGGIEIWLCERCLDKYEQYYLMSRPSATWRDPITRRVATFKVRHSLELMERPPKIAWVADLVTWFMEDEDGRWPCPACGERFGRLAEAIRHFADRHPEKVSWDKEYVKEIGEVSRTWQGYVCPRCGFFEASLEVLKAHYKMAHGGDVNYGRKGF